MKAQADKHRTDCSFEVGDTVLLKLQPFIQTSVARRPFQKLAFRYYGPFTVQARVGTAAYRLNLPATSKIHPVVHVSLLKRALGATVPASAELPPTNTVLQAEHVPTRILERKCISKQGVQQPRVLVQWGSLPSSLATWDDPEQLQRAFPATPPWGQGGLQERENVMTSTAGHSGDVDTSVGGPENRETRGDGERKTPTGGPSSG